MGNGKIKYIDGSGDIKNYNFLVNYERHQKDAPEIDRRVKITINGIISKNDIYGYRLLNVKFSGIATAQKEEFEAINSCGLVHFYPAGGTTPVYYGLVEFSGFTEEFNTWNCLMNFRESTELTSEFSFITAKVVNNDSKIYAGYDWEIAGINTAWLITDKGLASDCHNLKIRDRTGAFYDYYVIPETWDSSNTIFWIKKGNVDYYQTFFLQFVINDNYNYTQDPDLIFDYNEDFESYAVSSDINGQGGWITHRGAQYIRNDAEGHYLELNNNGATGTSGVYRVLTTSGIGNFALYRFKVYGSAGTWKYHNIGWGDTFNPAAPYKIENGYYTRNVWNYGTPTIGKVQLYKMTTKVATELATDDIVQDASKYFWSYFFWDGNTKKSGFKDTEISAIDTTFSSQDIFFVTVDYTSVCYIQQILIGKTARTKPTVTIYGQP